MTRTQVFKQSWAHTGEWPDCYPWPNGHNPELMTQNAELEGPFRREFWQMVQQELKDGLVMGLKLLSVVAFVMFVSACTTVTLRTPNCEASVEHVAGVTGVQRMETSQCWFEIRG